MEGKQAALNASSFAVNASMGTVSVAINLSQKLR
jgi:hypothetical protein